MIPVLRQSALITAVAGLTACGDLPDGGPAQGFLAALGQSTSEEQEQAKASGAPLVWTALGRGDVIVKGPRGYCVDPLTVDKRAGGGGFAVIASCNILSKGATGPQVPAVLVSVTVGPKDRNATVPTAETIATLAGTTLQSEQSLDGVVLAQLAEGGATLIENGEDRYWRAAFVQSDRLVSLAMYLPEGSNLAGSDGAKLLASVVNEIQTASSEDLDQTDS